MDLAAAAAGRKAKTDRLAKLKRLKIHGGRLSLADYLNESEPPFITPNQAIRLRCLDCVGNESPRVADCETKGCCLWRYRLGKEQNQPGPKRVSRSRTIRLDCLDCCGDSANEVLLCPAKKCPAWPYRRGPTYQRPAQDYWETHRRWE